MLKKYKNSIYIFIITTLIFSITLFSINFVIEKLTNEMLENKTEYYNEQTITSSESVEETTQESKESTTTTQESVEESTEETTQESLEESTITSSESTEDTQESTESTLNLDIKEEIIDQKNYYNYVDSEVKIADLTINSINLSMPIFSGFMKTEDLMLYGAVNNKENSRVGEGNFVISSHLFLDDSEKMFGKLHKLKKGDVVTITTADKTYTYIVYNNFTATNKDVWVVNDIKDYKILTMYTCLLEENGTINRTVVRAVLKE